MILSDIFERNRYLRILSNELKMSYPECKLRFLKNVIKSFGVRGGFDGNFWTFRRLLSKVKGFFIGARNSLFDGIGMYRWVGMLMFEY